MEKKSLQKSFVGVKIYLSDFQISPIDIKVGQGPSYTYQHFTLPNCSYIDHILILSPFLYNIYIEDLQLHIKSLRIGTFLPKNLHTGIIVYANEIILLRPTLPIAKRRLTTALIKDYTIVSDLIKSKRNLLFLVIYFLLITIRLKIQSNEYANTNQS